MKSFLFTLLALTTLLLVAPLTGCSNTSAPNEMGGAETEEAKEIAENLAKLSPEDRALAEKQQICPVGESALGSMGVPIKVSLEERDVFICCAGCESVLRENSEEYLAKIPE